MAKSRKRKVKLEDLNTEQAVTQFAAARLNKAINAVRVFGNCCGSKYSWSDEQIAKANKALIDVCEKAIRNIKTGVAVGDAGVTL